MELPKYSLTRVVEACRIDKIKPLSDGTFELCEIQTSLDDTGKRVQRTACSVSVDRNFFDRFTPKVGKYFVQYSDGQQTLLPAMAFESTFSLDAA